MNWFLDDSTARGIASNWTTKVAAARPETALIAEPPTLKTDAAANSPNWARRLALLASDMGTVTVEFMLWMPLIFTIILFAVDVSLIYLKQANMWNVARDTARRMSVDPSMNNGAATTYAQGQLFTSLQSATITPTGGNVAGQDKVVLISIPLCTASLFGVVGCYSGTLKLNANVTMASEY